MDKIPKMVWATIKICVTTNKIKDTISSATNLNNIFKNRFPLTKSLAMIAPKRHIGQN